MKTYATYESDIRNISYNMERLAMCLRMSKNVQEARECTAALVAAVGRVNDILFLCEQGEEV